MATMAEDVPFLSSVNAEGSPSSAVGKVHGSTENLFGTTGTPVNARSSQLVSITSMKSISAKAKPERVVRIQAGLAGRNNERRFKAPDCAPPKADKDKTEKGKGLASTLALGFIADLKDGRDAAKKKAQSMASNKGDTPDIGAIQNTIYDGEFLQDLKVKKKILWAEGLFSVDNDAEPSDCVFRCFHDWRAKTVDCIMLLTVSCSLLISPLSFLWNGGWHDLYYVPGGTPLLVFDILLDLVYMIYLFLQLNTSFLHPTRRVEVVERAKIVRHSLKSCFWWFSLLGATVHIWIGFGLPMVFNGIKLARLSHLVYLPDSLWRYHSMSKLRLVRPIMCLSVASHWIACLLSCVGGYSEYLKSKGSAVFQTSVGDNSVSGWVSSYFMAYVEALYMLTGSLDNPLGLGEGPRNKDFGSLLVVSIFGPVGCVVVALFISTIVQTQSLVHALATRHEENREYIKCALDNLNIPAELRRRVFSMHYFQLMGHDNEALSHLFNKGSLNAPLESALKVHLYMESMLRSQYFINKDPNYILEVVRLLEDNVFLPGDFVTRRGEVGSQMFFVARGILSVFTPDPQSKGMIPVCQKTIGDFFGEIALVRDVVRTASVRADTYVLVSSLARAAIEFVWNYWPEEREHLQSIIHDECLQANYRARLAARQWEKKLGQQPRRSSAASSSAMSAREEALQRADTLSEQLSAVAEDAELNNTAELDGRAANPATRLSVGMKPTKSLIEKMESATHSDGQISIQSADSIALTSRAMKFVNMKQAAVAFLNSSDSITLPPLPHEQKKSGETFGTCKCGDLLSIVSSLQTRVAEALEQQAQLESLVAVTMQRDSRIIDLDEASSPKCEIVPETRQRQASLNSDQSMPSARKKRVLRKRMSPGSSNPEEPASPSVTREEFPTFLEEDVEIQEGKENSSENEHESTTTAERDGVSELCIGQPYFPSVIAAVTSRQSIQRSVQHDSVHFDETYLE